YYAREHWPNVSAFRQPSRTWTLLCRAADAGVELSFNASLHLGQSRDRESATCTVGFPCCGRLGGAPQRVYDPTSPPGRGSVSSSGCRLRRAEAIHGRYSRCEWIPHTPWRKS